MSGDSEKTVAKVGTRVHVFSVDQEEDWGLGTITKVEPLEVEGTGEVISDNYPSEIKLDSGKVTEGMECWWRPGVELLIQGPKPSDLASDLLGLGIDQREVAVLATDDSDPTKKYNFWIADVSLISFSKSFDPSHVVASMEVKGVARGYDLAYEILKLSKVEVKESQLFQCKIQISIAPDPSASIFFQFL